MPNPLTISDAPDLINKGVKKIYIKTMPHKGEYTKKETEELKKKGAKPGTKKAHAFVSDLKKRRRLPTDGGHMYA